MIGVSFCLWSPFGLKFSTLHQIPLTFLQTLALAHGTVSRDLLNRLGLPLICLGSGFSLASSCALLRLSLICLVCLGSSALGLLLGPSLAYVHMRTTTHDLASVFGTGI